MAKKSKPKEAPAKTKKGGSVSPAAGVALMEQNEEEEQDESENEDEDEGGDEITSSALLAIHYSIFVV
jgi:hypothetical protein